MNASHRRRVCLHVGSLLFLLLGSGIAPLRAQDLYDTTVLRTLHFSFHDADWLQRLQDNYDLETPILADLVVDGVSYPDVGVRIRGNSSYWALPPGTLKFSLKVYMDHVHPNQDLLGYSTLNLNNAFRDPTFCREVVHNNFVARFIPNARSNHVTVTLNGANWGVYANVQQHNKRMLRDYFVNADGLRVKCSGNANGPALRYLGTDPSLYADYEIENDGGLADPLGALLAASYAVTHGDLSQLETIDALFAIDPSIWSVALENLFTDDDSYIKKGCDFVTYTDPLDGRLHLLQRDNNEGFITPWFSITRNFENPTKPLLYHILSHPELRQRYMAHFRTLLRDTSWSYFGPILDAHRNLIDAAVQADPHKLYSHELFVNNFTVRVDMPYPGLPGGLITGLEQFVSGREAYLQSDQELMAAGPTIHWVFPSSGSPSPTDPVWILASVDPAGAPVSSVELFYRTSPNTPYGRTPMLDDGASGDGAAGDGVYGVQLPPGAGAGQIIWYYVMAKSANAYGSLSFLPELCELGPERIQYGFGDAGIRITEWMYQGPSGEFVELTNISAHPVDLTGWSMDDDHQVVGAFDLGPLGIVLPGESVLITESDSAAFALAWGLAPGTKVLGNLGASSGNNFGRNDQIDVYDPQGNLADRLRYGDQSFPGSIRTQNASGQTTHGNLGLDDVHAWSLSVAGDAFGSWTATTGEPGTPGFFPPPPTWVAYCFGDGSATACPCGNTALAGMGCANSTGSGAALTASGSTSISAADLVLSGSGLVANQVGLYFLANNRTNGGQGFVFGDGLRCAGAGEIRLQPVVSNALGESSTSIDIAAKAMVSAGQTKHCQVWYRDTSSSPCSSTFNLSNGLSVTWQP